MKRICLLTLIALSLIASQACAENIVLASGAGYKKMVNALVAEYSRQSGDTVDKIYGNMARVTTVAKQGTVHLVLGDAVFLKNANLTLQKNVPLGQGKLVLAYSPRFTPQANAPLRDSRITRVALPDGKKAIYGKAARQYLTRSGSASALKDKLLEVATVPQVFSYIATDEVDMGFLNLTHALNVQDKLGGYIVLEQEYYDPISIVIGVMDIPAPEEKLNAFLTFLTSPEAQTIIRKHGL